MWTTNHLIPFQQQQHSIINTTIDQPCRIGKELWFLRETKISDYMQLEFFVFDTETHTITTKKCAYPSGQHSKRYVAKQFTSFGDQIYIWWPVGAASQKKQALFKLDTKSMDWEELVIIDCNRICFSTVIIDNEIFVLDWDHRAKRLDLIVVDLIEKVKKGRITLDNSFDTEFASLNVHNGQLYLLRTYQNRRVITKIENGVPVVMHHDAYTTIPEDEDSHVEGEDLELLGDWYNSDSLIFSHYQSKYLYLDTFNFTDNKWSRSVIPKNWTDKDYDEDRVQSIMQIDKTLYFMMEYDEKYEIKVFEM